ncbi:alpha amylase C-terminal domain-containing protein [bacterium]|nr:alpha amylase C-terminal domain-containing protein [bacterium]
MPSPAPVTVRFTYATGVRRRFLAGARLHGGWDPAGRPSETWSVSAMTETTGADGCPAFVAEATFPADQVGQAFHWGVSVDAPGGADVWGIPGEVRDVNSSNRVRTFDLLPAAGEPQEEEYHLCHARRLGAQKYYPTPGSTPDLRFGVWAPDAQKVELVFGTLWDATDPVRTPTTGPLPAGDIAGGYIADDPAGTGRDTATPPIPLARRGPLWFTDPGHPALKGRFADLDHRPYMFRVTRDDGVVRYKTDLYSRCQAGLGSRDPGGPFTGRLTELDGRVSCSVVVDPDTVTRKFDYAVWPEPAEEFIPTTDFWRNEFDPARPVPRCFEDLVIYELHIGALGGPDKKAADGHEVAGDFRDAINLLDYLVELGVNAVELLPMAEFGMGNAAWGYGNSHHFAVEYKAGGRDKYKHFVRECHRRGIAVIQDVVYNHYTPDAGRAEWAYASELPERNQYYWYEGRAVDYPTLPTGGYVDNYSSGWAPRFHEEMVRAMFVSSAVALAEEFHVDGFRVDLTDGIHSLNRLHLDGRSVPAANVFGAKFLREWCRTLKLVNPGLILVAEDHTGWDKVTAPPDQGGLGFDATWYSAFYHHLVGTLKQGPDWASLLAVVGTGGDGPLNLDAFVGVLRASADRHVVYHESHDEAGNSADSGRTMDQAVNGAPLVGATRTWAERRSRLVAGLSLLSAGTPMFLMGEEVAAAKPYRYNDWLHNREDLPGEKAGNGARMFQFYADLIRLRLADPAVRSHHLDVVYVHNANRVIAFRRWAGDRHTLVVASFANTPFAHGYEFVNPALPDGDWREVFNSDSHRYGGDDVGNFGAAVPCRAGRFRCVIPAAGFVVFHRA